MAGTTVRRMRKPQRLLPRGVGRPGTYAAQLMEAEQLRVRVRPQALEELPRYYRNSLIVCAVNPFLVADPERSVRCSSRWTNSIATFSWRARGTPDGRLLRVAKRAIDDAWRTEPNASAGASMGGYGSELKKWSSRTTLAFARPASSARRTCPPYKRCTSARRAERR